MSYTTIFKAYPGGTSGTTPGNLYAELKRPEEGTSKAALSFQRISGSYINSTMSIKRVTFEFRAAFSGSNEGTFTFQNSNGTVVAEVKDIDNNTGKNLYYRADYGSYPNDKNIFPPWEGAIDSALSSLLANDFTLYFCCLDALYNTVAVQIWKYNSAASGFNTNEWTCTVEWEYKAQLPTPPIKIGTSASSQGTTTAFTGVDKIRLYWSGATGGVDSSGSVSVSNYSISRKGTSDSITTTNSYHDFNFHATSGETYTYEIRTISSAGTSSPLTITLKTVYTEPGAPTNVKIGGVTQVYIGKTSPPSSFQLTWSAPSAGTNNTIVGYEIYKGSTLLTTTTSTSYSITSANYPVSNNSNSSSEAFTIKAKGKYGSGSASSSVATITAIAAPSNPSVSKAEIYSKDNPTLQWTSVPLETSTQSSLNYVVSIGSTQLYKGTNLSYYYPTTVADGASISFTIKTVVTAKHGGTVSSSGVTIKYTKMGVFSFPSDFWQGIQEGSTKPTAKNGYVYQNVSVSWKEPDSTRKPFTYQLQFRPSSNSNWQAVALNKNTDTSKLGFNIVSGGAAEGNVIGFQVVATDKYGISNTSTILTATKIKKPIINKLSASNIIFNKFQSNFSIQGQATNEPITYSIALKYENNVTEFLVDNQNISTSPTTSHSFNHTIDISLKGKSSSTNTCWKNLYTKVITNKYSQPTVSFVVKASYNNFKSCVAEAECSFQANYRNTPSTLATFTINNSKTFYNPSDTFLTSLSAFTWTDAAGGTSGATITHKIISNYTNKSYNIGSTITVPEVLKDTTVTFKTQTTIQYADGQEVFYNEASSLPKINIARWVSDSIYIKNFTKTTDGFEGVLYIPNTLCSSTTYKNLKSVALSANFNGTIINLGDTVPLIIFEYLKNDGKTWEEISDWDITGTTLYNQNASKDRIRFKITTTLTSCNFSIKTQWKNTSNKVLTIETPIFSYVAAAADFSIRKGRVGINVGEDFIGGSGSTLQVNAASYNIVGPIVEVISTNTSKGTGTNTTFLQLKDNSLTSKIYSNGTNLYIDNLKVTGYLPLTGGTLTGNLIINNSNSTGGFVALMEDSEGGTIQIGSKAGTYTYEIDAYNNESLRVHTAVKNPNGGMKSLTWNGKSGNFTADSFTGEWLGDTIEIEKGGTGATTAAAARTALGITPANIGAAPTSHASTATTYGAASASNYGHAMASSTTPKALGTAAVGSETAKFARGDHVHALPALTSCTGTLTVAKGGTGKTTLDSGCALIGNGTSAVSLRAITNNTAKGPLGWTNVTAGTNLITSNTLAYWNGAYTGTSSNISVLGTITKGTWNATKIGIAYGGTNATKRGADKDCALYNLGIFYATDLDSIGVTPQKGDICLIPV